MKFPALAAVLSILAAALLFTQLDAVPVSYSGTAPPARAADAAVRMVSGGGEHTCEVRGDRTLWCWGRNTYGELGLDRHGPGIAVPEQVGSGHRWATVSAGGADTCATKLNGTLWCWGVNHRGQLGDGTTNVREVPVQVGNQKLWKQVSAGWFHTCAVRTNGTLWCWGDNSAGQLGIGSTTDKTKGVRLEGRDWVRVAADGWHTCAIKQGGSMWCWGRNVFGQLGTGTYADSRVPARVGDQGSWKSVDVSWTHTCGLKTSGKVRCWGRNRLGQLGDTTFRGSNRPRDVAGGHVAQSIAVTEGSSCLVDRDGNLWCWGSNAYGRLSSSDPGNSPVPKMRAGNFTALTGGWMHLCTVNAEGKSACWGNNERGQLGNGTTDDTPNPTPHVRRGADGRGPGGPFDFGLATLNALGNGHSRPYAHDDRFAPSRLRAEWTAEALDALQLDVVGLQETTADQLAAIVRATHGAWQAFQTPETGDRGVETALLWRTSVWEATKLDTIRTQFITRVLPRPVVRLRHRATGRQIWVMDVHNAPWDYQAKRNKAVKAQLAKLAELEATGLPVFYVGDMNEKKTILCKVLRQTGLVTPIGGRLKADGTCVTPKRTMRVDWIFGSKSVGWEGYEQSRDPLVRLSTDHWVPVVRVHVP